MMKLCLQHQTPTIGVGIDSGKNTHLVGITDEYGQRQGKQFSVKNTKAGIEKILDKVRPIIEQHNANVKVVVNIEASGVYNLPLIGELQNLFKVNIYQPRQTRTEAKKNIRPGKNDKRDTWTLSTIHHVQQAPETEYADKEMMDVKKIGRIRYKMLDARTMLKQQFRQLVHLSFPGYDTLFKNIYNKVPWTLLKHIKTPQEAIELGADEIQRIIDSAARGQRCRVNGEDVIHLAETTIHNEIMARGAVFAIPTLMRLIEIYDEELIRFQKEIEAYWSMIRSQHAMSTVPFISARQAALLHVEFNDLGRFPEGDKPVAFAGMENFVYQSGESKNFSGRMTKAGSPIIRRILWEIVSPPPRYMPGITEHMRKLTKRGKHRNIAIHSASKKLVRILNAIERNKTPYRPPL